MLEVQGVDSPFSPRGASSGEGDSGDAWETSKENVKPIIRGRSVAKLNAALQDRPRGLRARGSSLEEKKKEFEDRIAAADEDGAEAADDPLREWIRYLNWLQEAAPSDTHEATLLLERCTRHFLDDQRYRQDQRYLKVWITYADRLSNPSEIFQFLYKRRICNTLALFWYAWAFVAEKAGNYSLADKLFVKGIDSGAEPMEALVCRRQQFQRRMTRHWLTLNEQYGGTPENPVVPNPLHGPPPSARPASSRAALGGLAGKHGGTNTTRRPTNTATAGRRVGGTNQAPPPGRSGSSASSNVPSSSSFQVFVDDDLRHSSTSATAPAKHRFLDDDQENMMPNLTAGLGSEKDRRKENDMPASKWSQKPLTSQASKSHVKAQKQLLKRPVAPVPIYQDPDLKQPTPHDKKADIAHHGLSVRDLNASFSPLASGHKPLSSSFKTSQSEVEALAKAPLKNIVKPKTKTPHKSPTQAPAPQPAAITTPVPAPSARPPSASRAVRGVDEDLTINTRAALMDVARMFASPPPGSPSSCSAFSSSKKALAPSPSHAAPLSNTSRGPSAAPPSFAIFTDSPVAPPPKPKPQPQSGFAIFSDAPPSASASSKAVKASKPSSSFAIFTDSPAAAPSSSSSSSSSRPKPAARKPPPPLAPSAPVSKPHGGLSFTIFDQDASAPSPPKPSSSKPSASASASAPFAIFSDDAPLSSAPKPRAPAPPRAPGFSIFSDEGEVDEGMLSRIVEEDSAMANTTTHSTHTNARLLIPGELSPIACRPSYSSFSSPPHHVPLLVPHSQAVLVPPLPVLPPSAARLPYHLLRPLVSPHHGKPRVRLCPSLPLLTIHALLGRGGFGVVYHIRCSPRAFLPPHAHSHMKDHTYDVEEERDWAIKVEAGSPSPSLPHEYAMLQALTARVPSGLCLPPLSLWTYEDKGAALVMPLGTEGSLQDLLLWYRHSTLSLGASAQGLPEVLALHYVLKMAKLLLRLWEEGGMLHCDVKPDNFLLHTLPTQQHSVEGHGLRMIDLGQAIDRQALTTHTGRPVRLTGEAGAAGFQCHAARGGTRGATEEEGWGQEQDLYGLAASAYWLLHGSLSPVPLYEAKVVLRRYWKAKDTWRLLLQDMPRARDGQGPSLVTQLLHSATPVLTQARHELSTLLDRRLTHMGPWLSKRQAKGLGDTNRHTPT